MDDRQQQSSPPEAAPEAPRSDGPRDTADAPSSYAQRVQLRDPTPYFRVAVERNLRIGRAAAANKKR